MTANTVDLTGRVPVKLWDKGVAVEHILKAILDHSAAYMLSSSTEGRELMSDRLSKHP